MRRPLTTLMLVATCGLLAVAAVGALGAELIGSASRAHVGAGTRTSPFTLSPAPDDLALAQVSFHRSGRGSPSAGSLHVAVSGPFGSDYLAAAVPRFTTPGATRALVLVVNRPSALLDPASVRLRIESPRSLGMPTVRKLENPFAPADFGPLAPRPALCDLPLHGFALHGAELRALVSRGAALAGFAAASAVAEAYDVACRLPYAPSFAQAVEQASSGSPGPQPVPPAPEPPVGKLPGEGCKPAPGYACPGTVASALPAAPGDGARRVSAGAH